MSDNAYPTPDTTKDTDEVSEDGGPSFSQAGAMPGGPEMDAWKNEPKDEGSEDS